MTELAPCRHLDLQHIMDESTDDVLYLCMDCGKVIVL